MDIYEFFHFADIAEHCKAINHVFSPLDMAIIVAMSGKPLKQKHKTVSADYLQIPRYARSQEQELPAN